MPKSSDDLSYKWILLDRMKSFALLLALLLATGLSFAQSAASGTTEVLKVGTSTIDIVFSGVKPDLSHHILLAYVGDAAHAVSHYYDDFQSPAPDSKSP